MKSSQESLRQEKLRMMLYDPMMKVIPKIAAPVIISIFIDTFYNMADTFFVSQLGQSATAAVAVNDSLMTILRAIAMGFGMGAASYTSRLLGAKNNEQASRVASTAIVLGIIVSAVFAALCYWQRSPIVMLMGITEDAHQYSMDYAKWILIAAPITTANVIMNQMLRSEGNSAWAMIGMCSGCFVNLALDPLFIQTFGWGVAGAAGATAISKVFSCVMLGSSYLRGRTAIELKLKFFTPSREIISELARMGIPAFLRMALMSVGSIVTNNVARGFGTVVLAAISIGNKISRFIGSVVMGLAQGANPVLGYCWGGRRYRRVREAMFTVIWLGSVIGLVIGALLYFLAPTLVGFFNPNNNELLLRVSVLQIRAFCIALIPHQLVLISSNLFQSLGRPVGNLILSMSRQLLVLIPLLLIIPHFYGADGLAVTQCISDFVSFFILCIPLSASLLSKFWSLQDGAEPPFDASIHRVD